MRRGLALGVPGLALATAAGFWTQVRRVVDAPLPHFEDGDPSGRYGGTGGRPVRVSVLGDSSVTGPGLADPTRVWVARLLDALPCPVELRCHAVGGSRVRDVLVRQAPAAVADPPELFVLAVGANDALHGTPSRQFARDLEALLELLRAVAPVVTLGIGDLSVIPRLPGTLRPVVSLRSAAVDRLHASVSAGRDGVHRVPVAELADPHFRRAGSSWFVPDLFHPNEAGHALWARLFEPYVRVALASVGRLHDVGGGVAGPDGAVGPHEPSEHHDAGGERAPVPFTGGRVVDLRSTPPAEVAVAAGATG